MIYRNWSLLSSTAVIWGGVGTVALTQFFLFGGKIDSPQVCGLQHFIRFSSRNGVARKRQKIRNWKKETNAKLERWGVILSFLVRIACSIFVRNRMCSRILEKFQGYLCREGERLRQQDRAVMAAVNRARMG